MNDAAEGGEATKKDGMNDGVMCVYVTKLRADIVGPDAWIKSKEERKPADKNNGPEKEKLFFGKFRRRFIV